MLQTLVRASGAPLSPLLVDSAFLPAVQCTMKTDDNAIMQVGLSGWHCELTQPMVHFLTIFILKYILPWHGL